MSKHMSNRVLWAIVVCILAGIQTSLRASPLLTETAKLTPNDNPNTPHFGNSVDISNDYIVIGAPFDNKELGAIYVFQRMGGNWEQQIKLVASDGVNEDHFGWSTAIDGDWIVVGAPRNNFFAGFGDGKAYVFHRVGNSWTEHTKLISSGGFNDFDYGTAVDISGNVIVVVARGELSTLGHVYVFRWNGTDWIEEAVLIGLDTQVDDGFGLSISIDGNLIAVGSRTDESGTNSGSVYLFRNNGSTWVQETKLTASDATAIDNFGISVATGNSYVVIGTSGGDSDVITNSGSVYVYRFDGMDWIEQVELFASDAGEFDGFGRSVATDGDYIIVGAPYRPCTCADEQFCDDGLAYLFRRNGVNWVEQYRLTATDATSICFFGLAVSLDGDLFVTGALDPGHTYVHFLPPPIPTVSQWGLVSMTLMILISGTILIRFL